MMKIKDIPASGLTLLPASAPDYERELGIAGVATDSQAQRLNQMALAIRNSSSKTVVAFALRWNVVDDSGRATQILGPLYMQPAALLDSGRARRKPKEQELAIRPGRTRVITPTGMLRSKGDLDEITTRERSGSAVSSVASVELDCAIFDDGEYVGPDTLGLAHVLQSHVNAEQNLVEQLLKKLATGEKLQDAVQELKSQANSADDESTSTRSSLLREIEITNRNWGLQTALDAIDMHRYGTRSHIHRAIGPNSSR